jgi:hypothetical protein
MPLLLRLPLAHLESIVEPRRTPARADEQRTEWLATRIDGILAAGRPVVRSGCLTRGVTLYYFLRRAGVDVSLQFGVGRVRGSYEGHCWLVRDGEPYLERVDPRPLFTGTYCIPRRVGSARA